MVSKLECVRQAEQADCALATIAMIANYYGANLSLADLRRLHPSSSRGMSLNAVIDILHSLGFDTRAVRCELDELQFLDTPSILHWDLNHYVVLSRVRNGRCTIFDPAVGKRDLKIDRVSSSFTGVALEVFPRGRISEKGTGRVSLKPFLDLVRQIRGLPDTLIQICILTIFVQLYVLISPLLIQISIDQVINQDRLDIIPELFAGFILISVGYSAGIYLRGRAIAQSGSVFSYRGTLVLVSALFRLPVQSFVNRDTGDLLSRMTSIGPIRDALISQGVPSLLDGALALAVVFILFQYSSVLAIVALIGLLLYAATTLFTVTKTRQLSGDVLVTRAREQQTVIESIRGFVPLKMFGLELRRLNIWQNDLGRAVTAERKLAEFQARIAAVQALIVALDSMVTIFVAIELVRTDVLSIGALAAFLAYKAYILSKAVEFLRFVAELRVMRLHLQRISDVVDEPEVSRGEMQPVQVASSRGGFELKDVSFRYSPSDPFVFQDLSLSIRPGEHVAICGPSGSGKSTLMYLLLGLLRPTSGEIKFDGIRIEDLDPAELKTNCAGVLQADQLFTGSIKENISFFDPQEDFFAVQRAALAAGIHHDIAAMPLKYETIVGDMGANFSGGQKQRMILARALYQEPAVLIVDEGTAHLDVENEKWINKQISELGITRIIFAHRPETLNAADHVYELRASKLTKIR